MHATLGKLTIYVKPRLYEDFPLFEQRLIRTCSDKRGLTVPCLFFFFFFFAHMLPNSVIFGHAWELSSEDYHISVKVARW